jgi:hypothetical protein
MDPEKTHEAVRHVFFTSCMTVGRPQHSLRGTGTCKGIRNYCLIVQEYFPVNASDSLKAVS